MLSCSYCQSKHINKNGRKYIGTQNYLYHNSDCSNQFQLVYKNQAANPIVKNYAQKALSINCSIQDIKIYLI